MYLIDTNICIAFLKGNAAVVNQFQLKHQDCYLSTLVLAELYKGVYCSSRFNENITALDRFANSLSKVNYEQNAALEFGKIQAELRRKGRPTGELDALIAAVPVQAELISTQQAANLLNVSRPYLIKLLKSEEIPHRKVGKHRRILAQDLYQYKADIDAKRSQSLDELTALSEELDLYEDD